MNGHDLAIFVAGAVVTLALSASIGLMLAVAVLRSVDADDPAAADAAAHDEDDFRREPRA